MAIIVEKYIFKIKNYSQVLEVLPYVGHNGPNLVYAQYYQRERPFLPYRAI